MRLVTKIVSHRYCSNLRAVEPSINDARCLQHTEFDSTALSRAGVDHPMLR